ncbi:retrotransposon gag domain, retroviral aspartyl protease [Tanacetum coccineum]
MSDMTACLNDLSFIPLNNEQNEPTQGDIGETSNEPNQAKRNKFEELYASANKKLYPGCDYVTQLDLWQLYLFKCTEPGKMQHPVDGRAWKYFDTKYLDFAAETRNVRLGLVVDGFNPFGNLSQSYSMWPVIPITYNLPLWQASFEDYRHCYRPFSYYESDGFMAIKYPARSSLSGVVVGSPEIDVYRAKFNSEFPNNDMKGEFLGWFGKQIRQRHVDNDPYVSESSELFTLAYGPSQTPISVNYCVVNGVRGVIVVEDDPDVIHVDNSSDLALSTSLNDLEIAALHIDGQSIDVDAPPDIIDVVDEDDDIIDEEDPIPHDLADSDDEDLVNLDIDDGVNVVYSTDVARGHDDDGGGDDRPPPHHIPTDCGGCLGNRGKGTRKPNLGGRRAGRLHNRQETPNLGDLVREFPLHHPSWRQVPPEQKAGVMAKIGAALKEKYWIPDGTYDLERIRQTRPSHISEVDWDAQITFWNDPKNLARAAQINKNGKEQVVC